MLGDNGLPYWKALNGFLLAQLRRDELTSMVGKWLKGPHRKSRFCLVGSGSGSTCGQLVSILIHAVQLHNNLLLGLLNNASIPSSSAQSPASANLRKRRKLGHDDPTFDIDDTNIEPKARIHSWVTGLTGKERLRIRRAVLSRDDDADGDDTGDWDLRRKRVSTFTPSMSFSRMKKTFEYVEC